MLSKLYITSNSDQDKLRAVHDLATEATELKIAAEASTRNGLAKLLSAVEKALGEADSKTTKPSRGRKSVVPAVVAAEDHGESEPVLETVEAQGVDSDTRMDDSVLGESKTVAEDSMLEELLDDE